MTRKQEEKPKYKISKNRCKKIVGYMLILTGILLPLSAFTSLSINNIKSNGEYDEYIEDTKRQSIDEDERNGIESYNKKVMNNDQNIVDPFIADEYKVEYDFYKKNPDKVFAYLVIPAINVKKPIRLDATYDHLANGVAQIDGTSLPVGGIGTRTVIAGHRGWYRDVMLLNLGELKKGDKVYINRQGNILEYVVDDTEIIRPSEWERLKPIKDKDMLTLLSCHPKRPPSPYRLLVNCVRAEKDELSRHENKSDTKIIKTTSKNITVLVTEIFIYVITLVGWIFFFFVILKFKKFLLNR
ncbi:class C sortase [Peptostreptococcus sp. D1]|uniref:class C sortase n=1 Tax=Peptostreptococcus sp. D1 TaxID=72304 RepID=UPI0008E78E9C|nr:class C sortase [Peptostreptococcus sp. D1]SFE15123.1 LPXTG-site transpeptidase (sortase) family protein [Peptostreptococcus sp. D1]